MIRVFHLIKSLGRGGAELLLPGTLRFADRDRFRFGYGYFLPWKDAVVPELEREGGDVVCFGAKGPLSIAASARRVARHLVRWEADLLHCHLPLAGVVGRVAGRWAGIPVVYTEHNKHERYHPLTRWVNLRTWGWQDRVVAVSGEVADSIHRHANGKTPVEVVRNGIDVRAFDPSRFDGRAVRRRHEIPEDAPVVGTVAVFRVQKALDVWLEAAREIRERHPGAHVLLVGDGPQRARLERRAWELGLAPAVRWAGLREDVRPYLAAMDLFLMSSVFEGLPLALLEAMAMARPVVATAVGGIPEVAEDGRNAVLVDPGDGEVLADRASALLGDEAGRARLGAEARRTVEARFGLERMSRELGELYEGVLGNGRGA